jgi:biopolymer transport protein TolR
VVMVTPTEILVQGRSIATVADVDRQPELVIPALRAALKQQTDRYLRASAEADVASREITILGDRTVPYRILKKVMASCTDADYGKLSLAVLQREEAMNLASQG